MSRVVELATDNPIAPPIAPIATRDSRLQAAQLKAIAHDMTLPLKDAPLEDRETRSTRAQAVASLVKAWDTARQAAREMRGNGPPRSVTARNDPSRKAARKGKPERTGMIGPSKTL